ncbi:MAG: hypothetical protein FWH27_17425 [Planctomycetaceae bacterium]|nr:hypothetical protein [Planctomycetaceae bacterium]
MNKKTEKDIVLYCLNNLLALRETCEVRRLYDWFEEIAPELLGMDVEALWEDKRNSWRRDEQPKKTAAQPPNHASTARRGTRAIGLQ